MNGVDQAIRTMVGWFQAAFVAVSALFVAIEGLLRTLLAPLGLSPDLQWIVIAVLTVILLVVILRLFGGILRALLLVFLILLLLHIGGQALGY